MPANRRLQQRPIVRLTKPLVEFVRTEAAGGIVLLLATLVALAWANSPWRGSYDSLWKTELALTVGPFHLGNDLRHWVNEGLMTIFFFVVGLEIKRELVVGELRDPRRAALPVVGALGGMVVPAVIYLALNAGTPGTRGWGIPMATDIAFAVGVLNALGPRVPPTLKVFLVGLAIFDDVGAIVVIAAFYSAHLSWGALVVAAAVIGLVVALRGLGVRSVPVYGLAGVALWLAMLQSGIHATIAGVALALLTPARALLRGADQPAELDAELSDAPTPEEAAASFAAQETVPVTERLEHLLHPWTGFLIVPLFALANAGLLIGSATLTESLSSRVGIGIVAGLVVGKPLGILAFGRLATWLGLTSLPTDVRWMHMAGAAALAGIGFTVSLFIADLAFGGAGPTASATLAILVASVISSMAGAAILLAIRANGSSDRG